MLMIKVYSPEQMESIAHADFMCRIAASGEHPELVEVYDNWALLVQPSDKRLEMGIAAAGLLVIRPFITEGLQHITVSEELTDLAIIEAERIKKDAAKKLILHAGLSISDYRGVVTGNLSEGPFEIKNPETGRSIEHYHNHILPKTPWDAPGGFVTAYSAYNNSLL